MNSLFKFNNMPLVTSKKWQSMMSCRYLNRWKVTSFRINDDTTYDFFFQTLPESLKISINMSGTCLSSLWQSLHAALYRLLAVSIWIRIEVQQCRPSWNKQHSQQSLLWRQPVRAPFGGVAPLRLKLPAWSLWSWCWRNHTGHRWISQLIGPVKYRKNKMKNFWPVLRLNIYTWK